MNNFSERLAEERKRLGMNQNDFAELGGVKKLAQFNYEKGERVPDAHYLIAVAAHGVDVQYLLTGVRSELPVNEIRSATESVFRMVQSGGVTVTPEQFSQMVMALLPSKAVPIVAPDDAGKNVAQGVSGNAQVAQGSGILQVGGKARFSRAKK